MATVTSFHKRSKGLRWGVTTGTCAAAATKAALLGLLHGKVPSVVNVRLPGEREIGVAVAGVKLMDGAAIATVIKDAGDDPDCTHGAEIEARVSIEKGGEGTLGMGPIRIIGGRGVGLVTRPGLSVSPGQWAINPTPRKMIRWAAEDVLKGLGNEMPSGVEVEIRVPRGEELARETLNPRLGIVGGISILGTTGLVKPFSHGAYRATIYTQLKVARANGVDAIHLVTGSTTDAYARAMNPDVPEIAFCQMADYVKFTMEWVVRLGFPRAHVYTFFGKAVKIAQGLPQTHASQGEVDLGLICEIARKETQDPVILKELASANTARHALDILKCYGLLKSIEEIGALALKWLKVYTKKNVSLTYKLLDFNGTILWRGD